ncbi:MAG: 50S ribosomal protein L1 [Bacteroidota bacterium]
MAKHGKKYREALKKVDAEKQYELPAAAKLVQSMSFTKFNGSVDLSIKLGVDPRQANQMVRGTASLPHGTGKEVTVLVLTNPAKEEEAKAAGADHVGLDEYIDKINDGWTDVDVIICSPDVMPKVGRLGRVLGPRGLMPNPKSGTVTTDVGQAVKEVKAGKIDFRVDKTGIINASVGKVSFTDAQLAENATELLQTLARLKPSGLKGNYFQSVHISGTMTPSVQIDLKSVPGVAAI